MTQSRPLHTKPFRIAKGHPRLITTAVIAVILFYCLPGDWRLPTRLLSAWDISMVIYLFLVFVMVLDFDLKRVRLRAKNEDEGTILMLILTVAAALASLGAVIALLGSEKGSPNGSRNLYFALAIATIVLSWVFIHTMFALHYAHEFYRDGSKGAGGLKFPNEHRPDYWDFAYFSFVIGMTFQVSDVQVEKRSLRHVVVVHGVVAFFFSVAILALAVNIGSNLI